MSKSRYAIAEANIKAFFNKSEKKVFSKNDLEQIFEDKKITWNLAQSTYLEKFIEQLIKRNILTNKEISFEGYIGKKERFVKPDYSIFELAASLFNKGYLTHYSAVYLNGLTTQVPKNIYITFEQSKKNLKGSLNQKSIDLAFSKPQREAKATVRIGDYNLVVHNGMYTGRAGVTFIDKIPVTNIERTLIDITVRPNYAGGVHAVLDAYKKALPFLSGNKLLAILDNMNFTYPYHQAVGFYLEQAGYEGKYLEKLKNKEKIFNFYLTYDMAETSYSRQWKLYYPKEM